MKRINQIRKYGAPSDDVTLTSRRLRTVAQISADHPCFSAGSLRWLIHQAERNGLARSGAIVRVGRRVLIDEEKFFSWIDEQQPAD
jgi:hypothetical protein